MIRPDIRAKHASAKHSSAKDDLARIAPDSMKINEYIAWLSRDSYIFFSMLCILHKVIPPPRFIFSVQMISFINSKVI